MGMYNNVWALKSLLLFKGYMKRLTGKLVTEQSVLPLAFVVGSVSSQFLQEILLAKTHAFFPSPSLAPKVFSNSLKKMRPASFSAIVFAKTEAKANLPVF